MLALGRCPSARGAQDTRPGIAVLPFDNGGSYGQDKENFEALRKGIAGMLISELAQNPAARLVDRSETQQLLDEQNLGTAGRVDAATAAKIGKLVGARYMIMGSFIDFYGDFRVDARHRGRGDQRNPQGGLQRSASSGTQGAVRDHPVGGPRTDGGDQAAAAAHRVSEAAKARNVPTEALTYYSRALLYQDRGDKAKATEYYNKALAVFPDYSGGQGRAEEGSPA